jgi:phosphoserine phosphatase RsbU/P
MNKRPALQYGILGVLLLWALVAQLTYSGYYIYIRATRDRNLPVPFMTADLSTRIEHLPPGYENTGLRVGDDVIALNGEKLVGMKQIEELRFELHPDSILRVTVEREEGGARKTLEIPIVMHTYPNRFLGWTSVLGLNVFLPISSILVGFYIAFARPRDPLAWITMAMLVSFGDITASGDSWAIWSPWREILFVYHFFVAHSWPVWIVLFGLYFPAPFDFLRRHRWPIYLLPLPSIVIGALDLYGAFESGAHIRQLGWLAALLNPINRVATIIFTCYVCTFFYCLGAKKHVLQNNDAKRRLNVMIAGCSCALLPIFPVAMAEAGFMPMMPLWLVTICLLMLLLFPLTMAYVIVVQRAMDVRMVIRSGVRYAIASNGLKVARIVLTTAIVIATIELAGKSGHRYEAAAIAILGAAVIAGFGHLARLASRWMDRRFFREAYNAEMVLTELSSSVANIRDKKALVETVAQRIADSMHVEQIAVLLERGGRFAPFYAMGFDSSLPPIEFDGNAATVKLLRQSHAPSKVYFDDPQSWVHGTPEKEQTNLQTLDTQVLLPVQMKNRVRGLISLGPKKSEAPYTRADLHLLGAVASQTGLALENAELTEHIRQEIVQRERLDRELEIAREVQQRLFPQQLPQVKGLDFAGYCRPALGVGGDYYDFIRLPDKCLGIAIGDVSGKGIAAALMMASLQASLRGQTIKPCAKLSEMIQLINRLVFDASAENRYATFFYGQYDPNERILRYVNAGHNAPIVFRRANAYNKQFFRLEEGGTVVGLFPEYPYTEAQLRLEPGDILVAFTDGISEAMSKADLEFGEQKLMEIIEESESRSAADTIKSILDRVDGFTTGAEQHDDMTLVVVRVQ